MTEFVHCKNHGRSSPTFVCRHLAEGSGLGFFYADDPGNPRPDAWCRACDERLRAIGEWNDETESFAGVTLICSGCYDEAKRRNCDNGFKFLCDSCAEVHQGVPGFGWNYPIHYLDIPESERESRVELTDDTCVIDGEYFFVRGNLEISVIDASEPLVFGVWASLSKENFDHYVSVWDNEDRAEEAPMFGWICSLIRGYPDTLTLKAQVYPRAPGIRPAIELEPTDHPLAMQQQTGINIAALQGVYEQISPGRFTALD